ncbi:MAG TPA: hypothetical protein VGG48_04465 [Rhizomicrobium sp.]|jgi:hypothetical protein
MRKIARVFFVGAGFSAPLRYPLGAGLPGELISRLHNTGKPSRKNYLQRDMQGVEDCNDLLRDLNDYLKQFFNIPNGVKRAREGHRIDVDLADFYSVAHALAETPDLFMSDTKSRAAGRMIALYSRIAAATRTYFGDISASFDDLPPDLESIIRMLRTDRDAVVDFNWDEEIDIAMCERGKDFDVTYTRGAWLGRYDFLLLKPHGSINWYDVSQGVYNEGLYFISESDPRIPLDQRRLVAYYDVEHPLQIDRKTEHGPLDCPPVITPPTFSKRFNYVEQRCVWQDVVEVCAQAGEFVFLGYRIPRDDYLTRAAMRAALTRNPNEKIRVLVVDLPNGETGVSQSLVDSFRGIFGPAFDPLRNVLPHEFGKGDRGFGDALGRKLKEAYLPGWSGRRG